MSRLRNAAEVAATGGAFGFAFLGAEELLSLLLRQPALTVGDLAVLLPVYVGCGAALGLGLGIFGVRGIAAAVWLWAAFTALLLGGPLGSAMASVGAPAPLGLGLGVVIMLVVAVAILFLTRDSDDYRWGALAGAWAVTAFAGVVNVRVSDGPTLVQALLNVGVLVFGVTLALAFGKALAGRTPKAGGWAMLLGVLLWIGRVPALNLVELAPPAPAGPKVDVPPVLLVMVSGLRADRLSFFNDGDTPTTPALDELARRSITYEQAHAAAPWSAPAVASLFTGQLPRRHGVGALSPDGAPATRLAPENRTVAEYLSGGAEVRTVALFSSPDLARGSGFDQGFDHYERSHGLARVPLLLPTMDTLLPVDLFPFRDIPPAASVVDRAIELMGTLGSKGWLLTVQLSDLQRPLPEGDAGAAYDDAVRSVDVELGRLLAAVPKDVWIIVVGDNGLSLGEHADRYPELQHPADARAGLTLYQEQLRVPLIVHRPRNLRPVSVLRPVRTSDIMPTLLEMGEVRPLTSLDSEVLEEALGRPAPTEDEPVVSEAPLYGPARTAVRRSEWKLIESATQTELYNLMLDPAEEANIAEEHPALVKDLGYELPGRTRPADSKRPPIEFLERFGDDGEPPEEPGDAPAEGAPPAGAAPVAPTKGAKAQPPK